MTEENLRELAIELVTWTSVTPAQAAEVVAFLDEEALIDEAELEAYLYDTISEDTTWEDTPDE